MSSFSRMGGVAAVALLVLTRARELPAQALDNGVLNSQTTVVQIGAGIHVIRHADATDQWPNGNTTVIIGDDGVLVVDSDYLPSVAEADIATIRKLTSQPVRYLVNTHWHFDHNNGNAAYRRAFPQIDIIAQRETRRIMEVTSTRWAGSVVAAGSAPIKRLAELRREVASGKDTAGVPLTDVALAKARQQVKDREREQEELRHFAFEPPSVTFDRELNVYLGHREIRIGHLYPANTPGDAFVYLPAEKVLVTGDLLVAPVPYAWGSRPNDWIRTLQGLDAFEAAVVVPGHGPVMRDKEYLHLVTSLLQSVVSQAETAAREGKTLDEFRSVVDLRAFRTRLVGSDSEKADLWSDSIDRALLERAYQEARGAP